nr:MAG TPA: hypothetical protein [Caudoviricetes sp.]
MFTPRHITFPLLSICIVPAAGLFIKPTAAGTTCRGLNLSGILNKTVP